MISVTDLTTYLYCPRKLYLKKVLKIYEPPKEVMIRGSVKHKLIEALNNSDEEIVSSCTKVDYNDILRRYVESYDKILRSVIKKNENMLLKFNIPLSDMAESVKSIIKSESELRAENVFIFAKENAVTGAQLWQFLVPKVKTEYRIQSKELGLKGIIDQLQVYKNKLVPLELKSGKMPREGVWPGHKVQLVAYALLLEKVFGTKIRQGVVRYIDHKKEVKISINPFMRDEVVDLINEVKQVLASKDLPKKCEKDTFCNACGMHEQCFAQEKNI
jgi:CRISPR-associated exonuclease Cas4